MRSTDREWAKEVYHRYAPELYRLASYRLRDPDLARDLTQEVFLVLLTRAEELRDHPKIGGWLAKTLEHKLLHEFDRQTARAEKEAPATLLDWLPDRRDHQAHTLEEILPRQLTHRERTVLKLVYEEGHTYREAAEKLGVPPATCGTWLHRARQKCKRYLNKEG